ncbi:hypothetical protein [Alcaligenes faecalis]|uniref:hypothetical protein n=1 Tax=Alcaligenes faecalis TaxID=511 RepID=UPI001EF05A1B|nr:hypothetical protein [Alcaligenes faecalis]ULH06464.1 hypothetical protein MF263_17565 [Alcaligenes faecalis]
MSISISHLAHSVRSNSATVATPISLGHAHQLVAAALGHNSLAAYQAAQRSSQEPLDFNHIHHVVIDYELLDQRAQALGIPIESDPIRDLIKTAFRERASHIKVHGYYDDLEDALRTHFEETVMNDSNVISEIANTNHSGIDVGYFDYEVDFEQTPVGETVEILFTGHVSVSADLERPYAGDTVRVVGSSHLDRLGWCCFGEADSFVSEARLDRNWSDDTAEDEEILPPRSMAQRYAEHLHLTLDEAQTLVDAPVIELNGSSGDMTYGYVIDFTEHASPEIAEKILLDHDSLRIEVFPGFFDDLRHEDWPH